MMKNQLAGLMKQAQQMQDNMKKAQEELARIEVEGQAGAGLVKVVMTCRHDVKRVTIDPSLLGEDRDMLEDLVAAAVNDAVRRVEATTQEKMAGLTGGHADAARLQAAVLTRARDRAIAMARAPTTTPRRRAAAAEPLSSLDALARALRCLPGVGPRPRSGWRCTCCSTTATARVRSRARSSTRRDASATASAATRSPRTRSARCAARRKRDPALLCVVETPADLLMVEQTQAYAGPLLRADGAAVAARRHRPEGDPPRPAAQARAPTAWCAR